MKISDFLSLEERQALGECSDARGWLAVFTDWGLIAAAFAAAARWPTAPVVLAALVIIGGRQLALAILVHDATHRSLFKSRALNDFVGRWVCGGPIWQDLHRYREHHMQHHKWAGSKKDPDRSLVVGFPVTRASLARKLLRDAVGITGLKRLYGLLLMDLGLLTYTVASDPKPVPRGGRSVGVLLAQGLRHMSPMLIANGLMLAAFAAAGRPWLYLLWVGAYLTTFSVFLRVRSIAEHACTDMDLDPRRSTRTTLANPMARLTVAPHRVNYHLEHHVLMNVPYFNLPRLHHLLRERGAYAGAHLSPGYGAVMKDILV